MATSRTVTPEPVGVSVQPRPQRIAATRQVRAEFVGAIWFKRALFVASDILAIVLAHALAQLLTLSWLHVPEAQLEPTHYYLIYTVFFISILHLFGGYKDFELRRPERELERDTKAVFFFFIALLAANFVLFKSWEFSRYLVLSWCAATLIITLVMRFGLRHIYMHLWRRGYARQNALLIGPPDRASALHDRLNTQRHPRHNIVGILIPSVPAKQAETPWPVLGNVNDWEKVAQQHHVKWLLLDMPGEELTVIGVLDAVRSYEGRVGVELHSDIFGSREFVYQHDDFSGLFRFSERTGWSRVVHIFLKSIIDFFIGLSGTALTLILTPLVALALKLEDGGPVFHRREFVDRDGHVRYYLKFRTMVQHADVWLQQDVALQTQYADKHKLRHDPRVLRVGRFLRKFSIDEFPQFFSVLAGKLTFVGPRVISLAEKPRYGQYLNKLLSVKPGMTGYWQVMGRQNTEYAERIRMDMFYIDHWSVWLDLVIIGKTFWQVLRAEGAY